MTGDPLVVETIDVRRAPGFAREGVRIDGLSEGINVVHGPNASGKSTLGEAIHWLLWPDASPDRVSVRGRIRRDGQDWDVDVDHGYAEFKRDGASVSGPSRPPVADRDRYYLALHDLLQHDTDNGSFAETIRQESAGGFDIDAAASELAFDASPTSRRAGVYQDAQVAIEDTQEAKQHVRELRSEQERLSQLEERRKAATAASERASLLEDAIAFAEARNDLASAQERIDQFPPILEDLSGDEAERVAELDDRIRTQKERLADAQAKLEEAEEAIEDAGLRDTALPDGLVDRLWEEHATLDDLEDDRRTIEGDLEGARKKREKARSQIPLDASTDDLEAIDPTVWEEVSEFDRLAAKVRNGRETERAVNEWLDDGEESTAPESALERGRSALQQWLSTPQESDHESSSARLVASAAAGAIGSGSVLLGVLSSPIYLGGVGVATLLAVYAYRAAGPPEDENPRSTHRQRFEGLPLDPPSSWNEDAVRTRLHELYEELAAQALDEKRDEFRNGLRPNEKELEALTTKLEAQRERLRSELGAAPETSDAELLVAVSEIDRWRDAHDAVVELEAKVECVREQIDEQREKLSETLAEYGYERVDGAETAFGLIRDLEHRIDTHRSGVETRERAENDRETARSERDELREQRDSILIDLGLEPDETERLRDRCEAVGEYEESCQERNSAAHHLSQQRTSLRRHDGYEPTIKTARVSELESEHRAAAAEAERYDDLHEEITQIETKIDEARRATDVETALAEQDRALDELREQLGADSRSMVGNLLVEELRDQSRFSNRPEVFDRARDVLVTVTKGHYDLAFDDESGSFVARDTVQDRTLRLDELSDGTRLQLLLAVRVAFVEVQEGEPHLPLVLDETLANSDDDRASIVIESVIDLARDGRQIFYFTAQGDEVARWQHALAESDVSSATIDLADALELDTEITVPEFEAMEIGAKDLPDPEAHDHRRYGAALDVPAFDPRSEASDAHLWYLVDDVETLHLLLDVGIERWGQLETLLDRPNPVLLPDDRSFVEDVELAGVAVEAFVDAWQRGRGDPVDRAALEDSGAVSENFIDEVTELARAVDGDGEQIVEALRDGQVDRFRSSKADELEAYFEAESYIEATDTLEPDEMQQRVLQRLLGRGVGRRRAVERASDVLERLQQPP